VPFLAKRLEVEIRPYRTRVHIVREYHCGPNGDAGAHHCWLEHECTILDLGALPDLGMRPDLHATTDNALGAELCGFPSLRLMPEERVSTGDG
jgi:hypothetical protein